MMGKFVLAWHAAATATTFFLTIRVGKNNKTKIKRPITTAFTRTHVEYIKQMFSSDKCFLLFDD
jgi:hypothetical protein